MLNHNLFQTPSALIHMCASILLSKSVYHISTLLSTFEKMNLLPNCKSFVDMMNQCYLLIQELAVENNLAYKLDEFNHIIILESDIKKITINLA